MAHKMPTDVCRCCKHFIQHYALRDGKFHWVNCGHCTNPKFRARKPWTKARSLYEYSEPNESLYVDQEYLSKSLLQRVLAMELLPHMDIREDA